MNRLHEFRRRAHITQAQLAQRSGLSSAGISKIESWKSHPQSETQKKIAAALHVGPEEIFDMESACQKQHSPDVSLSGIFQFEPNRITIHCRWCHNPIIGLTWIPKKCELIIKPMPHPAKVHGNGFFYHENCLKEKLRVEMTFPFLREK